MTALVMEYLKEEVGIVDNATLRTMANGLLMSTAVPVVSQTSGVEASPRQQGAGLVNAYNAVTAEAYVTVDGTEESKPKAELGASASGLYSFIFTVHNFSDEEKTYTLSSSLLSEGVLDYGVEKFMAGYDVPLDGTVTFSQDTVTVSPNGTASVAVTIALSSYGMSWLDYNYPNGGYVEGYVYLTDEAGVDLSIPYLGYYGDWSEPSAFDTAYWYDNSFWDVAPVNGLPEGNEYYHVLWTSLGDSDWVLGMNPFYGATLDENGNVEYDPANNVISNNGDGVVDNFLDIYISMMRNAEHLHFSYQVKGEDGNVEVYWQDSENVWKTMYMSAYGQVVPYVHSWWFDTPYDFTDENGDPLPHGTEMELVITAALAADGAYKEQSIVIPLTLDVEAPVLDESFEITTTSYEGKLLMNLRVMDDTNPAYAVLLNPSGATILADSGSFEKMSDGTYAVALDITDLGSEFLLALGDYGCNEGYYELKVAEGQLPEDGNLPTVDTDALYAYRVYDAAIYDDSLFGWITIDKETAETTQLTNDMYEYYALNAAEYVDGYIFGVDAGYNFVVMQPGLFFRKTICNLGVSVLDMTFNEADDTMYVSTKAADPSGYGYIYTLSTLDLLTGELTTLTETDDAYELPYAMAATDDGTIYAIKYYDSGLYTVDQETWALEPVLDAEGNAMELVRANGYFAAPYYSQSMTYSAADDCIYWAFFTYTNDAELFTIDLSGEVPTYTAVEFPVDAECVGLLTMEEDEYTLPESDALSELVLSEESVILIQGEEIQLYADTLPWNYDPSEDVVWTSSKASIASVDADGLVTAVSEGTATITASCEGVTASCVVNVVKVEGDVYAYNYFNYTGEYETWVSVDLENMTTTTLYDSPVDFMAADYNGHDGNIYGYDVNGQFYRFDPATGDCVPLGSAVTNVPTDMAYDYSSGYMYAVYIDYNQYCSVLCYVNMNTGALVEVAPVYDFCMTLACDTDGGLYAISSGGVLYYLYLYEMSDDWGGGAMPVSIKQAVEAMAEGATMVIEPVYIMEGLGTLQYAQSMCFDHNNYVLIWANPETSSMYWIDPFGYEPYALPLGDPTNSGMFEFMGLYTIPEEIPELSYTEVISVTAEDMLVLVGSSKLPAVTIDPLNATNQDITLVSADETVAKIENGMVVGVSEGSTTVNGTLVDGETTHEFSFTVVVKESTGYINGFVVTDVYSGGGESWAVFNDQDPTNDIMYPAYCGYLLYSEEYVDGKLYAYGYDSADWEANFQFMVIDAATYEIETLIDMGDGFPFVYDMTFDYSTGTMFAVAGNNDSSSDLYMVNMETGDLVLAMETESFFMSLTGTADGTIYAISASEAEYDWDTDTEVYSNAKLYTLDVANGTYTKVFDLGVQCNKLASMAYDYDTGNIYWSPMFQASYWDPMTVNGLYMIDLEEQAAYDLGKIGYAGSSLTGMYIVASEYPETPDELLGMDLTSTQEEMNEGDSLQLETFIRPADYDAKLVWSSSDESVVTVDENGVVTAVGAGKAVVTVVATDANGNTFTATCTIIVYSNDDCFLVYNRTDSGFSKVLKTDTTVVENLTEGETEAAIRSMAMVDGVIYGYDVDNKFFSTTVESGFVRTYLGGGTVELPEDTDTEHYYYEVRDLAWDSVNERMIALVCKSAHIEEDWGGGYINEYDVELSGGCLLYEVNMANGTMTELYSFGDEYSNIYTVTVDDTGVVYVYTSYDDYVCTVDVGTGVLTKISTLQNQGVYGDSDGNPMAMDYDARTGNVYLLFTSNGTYYKMVSFTPSTGKLTVIDYVGDVYYDMDTWSYQNADLFSGLIITSLETESEEECQHTETEVVNAVEPTETTPGYSGDEVCKDCGEVVKAGEELPATGEKECQHTDTMVVGMVAPTMTTPGYSGDVVCKDCGVILESGKILPATGGIVQPERPSTEPDDGKDEEIDLPFVDVAEGEWFYEFVEYVYANGLMNGVDDTHFEPNSTLTRGMIVTILHRMEGKPAAVTSGTFDDVALADWYGKAVEWAAANAIVNGYDNGNFGPNDAITREQLAAILFRYAQYKGYDVSARNDLSSFSDADAVSAYAVDAMQWAVAEGLINGSNGKLTPKSSATRAQVAAIITRFLKD